MRVFDFLCTVALHVDKTFQRVLTSLFTLECKVIARKTRSSPPVLWTSMRSWNNWWKGILQEIPVEVLSHTLNDLLVVSFVSKDWSPQSCFGLVVSQRFDQIFSHRVSWIPQKINIVIKRTWLIVAQVERIVVLKNASNIAMQCTGFWIAFNSFTFLFTELIAR